MQKEAEAFYRNPGPGVSLDSAESSLADSLANESDYRVDFRQIENVHNDPQHNELIEKLSMLKFGEEKNIEEYNIGSKYDSVLARNTPTDSIYHRSVHSFAESSYSLILAGRFDEKEDLENAEGEASLLNIAIRESSENKSSENADRLVGSEEGSQNQSLNKESIRFVDSLELEREKRSNIERDSLENCARYAGRDENIGSRENSATRSGDKKNRGRSGKPIVISNETVDFDLKALKARGNKGLLAYDGEENFISKDKNDNIRRDFDATDSREEIKYMSFPTDSEQKIIADLKTPKSTDIRFIEDCCKSTPFVGNNADTFGSDFVSDVESFSRNCENGNENYGQRRVLENRETSCHRDQVFKRFSQRFAEAPIKFTEQLINLMNESILQSKVECNMNNSDVSLSRLTEEFRQICKEYGKRIEDESMPDFGAFQVSSFRCQSLMETHNEEKGDEEEEEETKSRFASLGGGKKVYRKTPRRILKSCSSPNCANIMHRVEKRGLDVTRYCENAGTLDNTETFEFWENLCLEMSPTKQARFHAPTVNDSTTLSHEDFLRRSDRQMAALNQSCQSPGKFEEKGLPGTLRSSGNDTSNMGIRKSNGVENRNEIEEIIEARIVEKRRKCFEEASKVSRGLKNESVIKTNVKNESSKSPDYEAVFFSTISACVEYFDHIKNLKDHRHSLQCILECSEESMKSAEDKSVKCVEAFIMPLRNSGKRSTDFENEEKSKLVAEAYLDLSATPGTPEASLKNLESSERLSPNQRISSGARSPSVLSKKIKRSISPIPKRVLRTVKPASHSNVPRTPVSVSKKEEISDKKLKNATDISAPKSSPRLTSNNKYSTNSLSLMDVTNIRNSFDVPKVLITTPTPPICRIGKADENMDFDCKRELKFSASTTPTDKKRKFFYTPGKTPVKSATSKPKKRYFETPRQTAGQSKPIVNSPSPGSYRLNYNTVPSPVGMYIRGTNPNLITNVRGKTNERMLTPRVKTPRSKSRDVSPILARSPRLSPKRTETAGLKFQLSSGRKQHRVPDILNVAICEVNVSSVDSFYS